MGKTKTKSLLCQVKEAVDCLYQITNANGGYRGTFNDYPATFKKVVGVLVHRGIILRVRNNLMPRSFIYNWAVQSHPTDTLYKSVAQEMRDTQKKYEEKSRAIAKKRKASEPVVVKDTVEPAKRPKDGLEDVPSQLLWDELKRRGYGIEGERLVKKDYLE